MQKNGLPGVAAWCAENGVDPGSLLCSSGHSLAYLPGGEPSNTCAKYRWRHKETKAVWKAAGTPSEETHEWYLDYVFVQCKHGVCGSKSGGTQSTLKLAAFVEFCKSLPAVAKRAPKKA